MKFIMSSNDENASQAKEEKWREKIQERSFVIWDEDG